MKKNKSSDKNQESNTIDNDKLKESIVFKDHPFYSLYLNNQKLDDIINREKSKFLFLFGEKSIFNNKSKLNQKSKNFSRKNNRKLTKTFSYKKNANNSPVTFNDSNSKIMKSNLNVEKQKSKNFIPSNSTISYTKSQNFYSPSRNIMPNKNKLIMFHKNNAYNLYKTNTETNKKPYKNFEDKISLSRTFNKFDIIKNTNDFKLQKKAGEMNFIKQTIPTSTNATNTISNLNTDNFSLSNNLFFITNLNNTNSKKRAKTDINLHKCFFDIKNLEKNYETNYNNLINYIKDGKIEINNRVKKWERRLDRMDRKNNYEIENVEKLENDEDFMKMASFQKKFITNFIKNFGDKSQKNASETENNNSKLYTNKYIYQYNENFCKEKVNYDLISFKHKNFKKMLDQKKQELVKANKYVTKLIAKNKNYSNKKKKEKIIEMSMEEKNTNKNKITNNNYKGIKNIMEFIE